MTDIKLNDKTWDIDVSENGDMIVITGIEALRQRLRIKLQHVQGEWFADTTSGVMSFSVFGEKNPDTEAIKTYLKQEIESDSEVVEVTEIAVNFSSMERIIYIKFTANTIYGTIKQEGVQ